MTTILTPPAAILVDYLCDKGEVSKPEFEADWPAFINEWGTEPNEACCISDTTGVLLGRYHNNREVVEVYGIQIRLRSLNFESAWEKAQQVKEHLEEEFEPHERIVGVQTIKLKDVIRRSPIIRMGKDDNDRHNLTINYLMSITVVG